jgi:hypothetical protein
VGSPRPANRPTSSGLPGGSTGFDHMLRMRDIETIDSELRLVAAVRRAARERGRPLPSTDVADALLDERRELTEWG